MIPASIIIPALNEAGQLPELLAGLQGLRDKGCELILVDGGSQDATCALAEGQVDQLLSSDPGRAQQMNLGAKAAQSEWLFFLHADTRLTPAAQDCLLRLAHHSPACWGRFDVSIQGRHPLLKLVAWLMNGRSRLTGVATGDQLIFVHVSLFKAVGGFPDQPLMEDVELSKRLKQRYPPLCLKQKVLTSGRRWE
ncbi:TIGR04283 family arsenosugar biosynthesis glycosyltransferase, partial [Marinospirillum sp.]|uniref:TIGR04283 family arsenosugar biosynthesis glycosyltransferase n=1 Tax=Marinospirillum sp. TaxID=2183934 RepID=UPI0028709935